LPQIHKFTNFYAEEIGHTQYKTHLGLWQSTCMVPFWSWFLTKHTHKPHRQNIIYVFVKMATFINSINE